jgi:hypothetical protein
MNTLKIILATVIIFGAGVITGGLLVKNAVESRPKDLPPPTAEAAPHPQANNPEPDQSFAPELLRPRPPEMLGKQFVQQLDKKLLLTPEQRLVIGKIVAEGQERNHEIWTNVAPELRRVLQDVRQQIRDQLTPDQRKKYEELLKRFRPAGHHPQPSAGLPPATNEPPGLESTTNPPPAQ